MGQRCVGEIAKDCGGARLLHGEGVMRSLPALGLSRMATGASLGADECGRRICWRFRFRRVARTTNLRTPATMATTAGNRMKNHVAQFLRHQRPQTVNWYSPNLKVCGQKTSKAGAFPR